MRKLNESMLRLEMLFDFLLNVDWFVFFLL